MPDAYEYGVSVQDAADAEDRSKAPARLKTDQPVPGSAFGSRIARLNIAPVEGMADSVCNPRYWRFKVDSFWML